MTKQSKKKKTPPDVIVNPVLIDPETKKNNIRKQIHYKIVEDIRSQRNHK